MLPTVVHKCKMQGMTPPPPAGEGPHQGRDMGSSEATHREEETMAILDRCERLVEAESV
jgi:hypothetical protein